MQYSPVVIVNGLAAILFMIGYVLFGIAMIRIARLLRWSGVLIAVGAPAHLIGFGISQLVSTAAWSIAILGSVTLGAVWHRVRVIIFRVVATLAGAIILPFQPGFAAILAIGVIPLIAHHSRPGRHEASLKRTQGHRRQAACSSSLGSR